MNNLYRRITILLNQYEAVFKIYIILCVGIFLYLNPFHWLFVNEQFVVMTLWLLGVYCFKLPFHYSFLFGLAFIVLAALSTFLGHPGFAQRFAPITFWFFVIGVGQKIAASLQISQSAKPSKTGKRAQFFSQQTLAVINLLESLLQTISRQVAMLRGENNQEKLPLKNVYKLSKTDATWILLLLLPLLAIYKNWFSALPLAAGDWVYKYPENVLFQRPYAWITDNLGVFNIPFLWSYPLQFIETVIYRLLAIDFGQIEKIVWFIPILLISFISVAVFVRTFGGRLVAITFAVIFFLTNTYSLLLFSGGQMLFALGFALFPLVFASVHWAVYYNKTSLKILSGLGVALLGFADPRIALLFLFIVNLYLVFKLLSDDLNQPRSLFRKYLTEFLALYSIPIILHLYWIIPTFLTNTRFHFPNLTLDITSLQFSFMTLNNIFTVFQPHWPENIFGKISHTPTVFYVFPFIFYTAPFLLKRPIGWFFVALSLFSAFLTKGTNPPLGEVYTYLLQVLPGFQLFRDPSKFYVPLIVSYTLLFGLVVERIFWGLRLLTKKQPRTIQTLVPWGFLVIVSVFLYGLSFPAFQRTMDGTLQGHLVDKSFISYYEKTKADKDQFYRSLWIPLKSKFAYQDATHPIIDGIDLATYEPFNGLIKDDFHTFTYLEDGASIEFLQMIGARFLHIRRPTELRFNNARDKYEAGIAHDQLVKSLETKRNLKKVNLLQYVDSFEIENPNGRFYAADKVFWVFGSSKVYSTIKTLPEIKLNGNAFIRRETLSDIPLTHKDLWQAQIIESNYATESGVLSFGIQRFDRVIYIFNTEILGDQKNVIATIEGLPNTKLKLFIRRYKDATGDEEQVYGRQYKFVWQPVELTKIEGQTAQYQITFPAPPSEFQGGTIDRVLAYSQDQIPSLQLAFNTHRSEPIIEVKKATPTEYALSIREATLPYMLIFNESFNRGWQAKVNEQAVLTMPVFNLLNGFLVDTSGNYNVSVSFLPQQTIAPFAYLSFAALCLFLVYLLVSLEKDYALLAKLRALFVKGRPKNR